MALVFDGQRIIEEVADKRGVLRKKGCLGEELWLDGSEFFESSGANNYRRKLKDSLRWKASSGRRSTTPRGQSRPIISAWRSRRDCCRSKVSRSSRVSSSHSALEE